MGLVLELLKPEIDKTIKGLDLKNFEPDPIAGPHFSKITSVMSSAYKRHGYILERAILESLRLCPYFEVWNDPAFQVPSAVEHIVEGSIAEPIKLIGTDYPYSDGQRTLQVDAVVLNKNTGTLGAYEVKRGAGLHDSGKRRSMLKDALCIQVLLKHYASAAMTPRARSATSYFSTANVRYQSHLPSREPRWTNISRGLCTSLSMR